METPHLSSPPPRRAPCGGRKDGPLCRFQHARAIRRAEGRASRCARPRRHVRREPHGRVFVSGPDALALVQWVSSNDASPCSTARSSTAACPTAAAALWTTCWYRLAEDRHMLVVNAATVPKTGFGFKPKSPTKASSVAGRRQRQACVDRASRPKSPARLGSCPRPAGTVSLGRI